MRESLLGPESRARAARVELWLVRVPAVPATLGPGPDQYNTPGSTASHTTVVTHKRGCVIHTPGSHTEWHFIKMLARVQTTYLSYLGKQ